jgi:ribosomal protein S18 acetylase RimI-like enzyme
VPSLTDAELYARGCATLVASWGEYARGVRGAMLHRLDGAAAAVFTTGPERDVYNNALLEHGLEAPRRSRAISEMQAAYAAAGVTRYAAWVHERDAPLRRELERHGYRCDSSTRAMAMALDHLARPRPTLDLGSATMPEHARLIGLPPGFQAGADPAAFAVLVAQLDGESSATALGYEHRGDLGIYNVETLPHARRRGLGTALTVLLLHEARTRGCRTASLQSTPMAERMYAAVGFRDLGRILEYVPGMLDGQRDEARAQPPSG